MTKSEKAYFAAIKKFKAALAELSAAAHAVTDASGVSMSCACEGLGRHLYGANELACGGRRRAGSGCCADDA
jgi:hypothetical protein